MHCPEHVQKGYVPDKKWQKMAKNGKGVNDKNALYSPSNLNLNLMHSVTLLKFDIINNETSKIRQNKTFLLHVYLRGKECI